MSLCLAISDRYSHANACESGSICCVEVIQGLCVEEFPIQSLLPRSRVPFTLEHQLTFKYLMPWPDALLAMRINVNCLRCGSQRRLCLLLSRQELRPHTFSTHLSAKLLDALLFGRARPPMT